MSGLADTDAFLAELWLAAVPQHFVNQANLLHA